MAGPAAHQDSSEGRSATNDARASSSSLAFADLASVKAEPDLNRRSELALMNADEKIDAARQAYQAGNETAEEAAIQEVADSVTLCYESLEQTHGAPRKSRYYKQRRTEGQRADAPAEWISRRSELRFSSQSGRCAENSFRTFTIELMSDIMSRKKIEVTTMRYLAIVLVFAACGFAQERDFLTAGRSRSGARCAGAEPAVEAVPCVRAPAARGLAAVPRQGKARPRGADSRHARRLHAHHRSHRHGGRRRAGSQGAARFRDEGSGHRPRPRC